MAKEHLNGKREKNIKVNTEMIKKMEMADILGQMENNTSDSLNKI